MKLGTFLLSGAVMAGSLTAWGAEPPTFTKDVLPILQENCQTCHRPAGRNMSGMVAPMSLMTYQEVRPWAKAIVQAVESGQMPPWHASEAQHGVFKNERGLTNNEIATIADWAKQGARRGNPNDAPPAPEFREGWYMGEPDAIIEFPEPYFVEDDVEDLYQNISVKLTEETLPREGYVQSLEFRPGSEVVHHIIAFISKDGNQDDFRGRYMLGGLAPGTDPHDYPEGYGKPLHRGDTLTFQMHYHKEPGPGTGRWDDSVLAIKFHDKPVKHVLETTAVSHGDFEIPPFTDRWRVGGARTFDEAVNLISLMPHTHLRGTASKYTAFYPDGTSEVLLDVPNYDFNWQTEYTYKEVKHLPAGTRIEWEAYYDNSKDRAEWVGIDPSRPVRFGGPTTDEMDLGFMTIAPAEPQATTGD